MSDIDSNAELLRRLVVLAEEGQNQRRNTAAQYIWPALIGVGTALVTGLFAFGGNLLTHHTRDRELDMKMFEFAWNIYATVKDNERASNWAVAVIGKYSGEPFPPQARNVIEEKYDLPTFQKDGLKESSGSTAAPVVTAENLPPPPELVQTDKYIVYLQFAGFVRSDIVDLNAALKKQGWRVQSESGERTGKAAGINEVRYGVPGDVAAAEALAAAVSAASRREVKAVLVEVIKPNTLEIWISR